jgi:hypothetical protein
MTFGFAQLALPFRAFGHGSSLGKLPICQKNLRYGVQQFAFLFPNLSAPNDGQQLALLHGVTKLQRPGFWVDGITGFKFGLTYGKHLAAEPGMNPR